MMRKQSGFTLVELMIVIAIIAIFAAIALPSFSSLIERGRLKSATEVIKADIQFARSEAMKRSADVTTVFTSGTPSYTMTDASGTIKTVDGTQFSSGVAIAANTTVVFNFRRGNANASDVTLSTTNYQSRVVISNRGRVGVCTPAGQTGVGGYPGC